jgi:predicted Abi (CAAX) family protease
MTNSHYIYGAYADAFYAPFYMSADEMMAGRSTACDLDSHYHPMLLGEARCFKASGGIDHIFLQMWQIRSARRGTTQTLLPSPRC